MAVILLVGGIAAIAFGVSEGSDETTWGGVAATVIGFTEIMLHAVM